MTYTVTCAEAGDFLTLDDSTKTPLRFHAVWLRDNALDGDTRAPGNQQRLITMADIDLAVRIDHATLQDDVLTLRLSDRDQDLTFPLQWLLANAYDRQSADVLVDQSQSIWDSGMTGNVPTAPLADMQNDAETLHAWLANVARFGFAKVTDVPCHEGSLFQIVDLFGYVRETNYGRLFQVRSEVNPSNLAYTGMGLQGHTDNPYRDPVPSLQILSCLENSAQGGDSTLIDGFAVAARLRQENPDYFDILAGHVARFEYAGTDGVHLLSRRPMIEVGVDGRIQQIRFNSRSTAPIRDVPFDKMADYYAAYHRFAAIVDDPEMAVSFKLSPGEAFIVDNTRILHARRGFSGAGNRWLQGCYADKDGLLSKLSSLSHHLKATT